MTSTMLETALGLATTSIEAVFLDECAIARPVEGGGTLGGTSGWAVTDPTPTDIYTGRCIISPIAGGTTNDDGDAENTESKIRVRVPLECPHLEAGDQITVTTASGYGSSFVGLALTVDRALTASAGSSRFAVCHRTEADPTRDVV